MRGKDRLKTYIDEDQLPVELGGSGNFDFQAWMMKRAEIEGVELPDENEATTPQVSNYIEYLFSDLPVTKVLEGSKRHGWLKKRGSIVQKFNDRFCVLKNDYLFYFKERDSKKEGVVPLNGSRLVIETKQGETDQIFHIITSINKDCIFAGPSKITKLWIDDIQEVINK